MVSQIPEPVIRDTVAAVFSGAAYNRSSLLERFGAWLLEVLEAVLLSARPAGASSAAFWTVVVLLSLAVSALVARAVLLLWLERRTLARGDGRRPGITAIQDDAWAAAARLAGGGDYTAAAHALYAAMLNVIARRGAIELHESRTIGDYTREVRRRSPALLPGFSEFTRGYERAIYGMGFCDRNGYDRLHGLALSVERGG